MDNSENDKSHSTDSMCINSSEGSPASPENRGDDSPAKDIPPTTSVQAMIRCASTGVIPRTTAIRRLYEEPTVATYRRDSFGAETVSFSSSDTQPAEHESGQAPRKHGQDIKPNDTNVQSVTPFKNVPEYGRVLHDTLATMISLQKDVIEAHKAVMDVQMKGLAELENRLVEIKDVMRGRTPKKRPLRDIEKWG